MLRPVLDCPSSPQRPCAATMLHPRACASCQLPCWLGIKSTSICFDSNIYLLSFRKYEHLCALCLGMSLPAAARQCSLRSGFAPTEAHAVQDPRSICIFEVDDIGLHRSRYQEPPNNGMPRLDVGNIPHPGKSHGIPTCEEARRMGCRQCRRGARQELLWTNRPACNQAGAALPPIPRAV